MSMGPNYRNLVAVYGQTFMVNTTRSARVAIAATLEAMKWVASVLHDIQASPGNPFGDDQEAICGEILNQLQAAGKIQRIR